MSTSASRANASPACSADTVPDRMRVPIRNICSCAKMRMRSRKSSYDAACRSERSRPPAISHSSGNAPKKLGSITRIHDLRETARGCRPAVARCRARARSARSRSGFCRNSENSRPPPCSPARKRSKAMTAASGFAERANWWSSTGTISASWPRANSPFSDPWVPVLQRRTRADTSSGWRNPISVSRSRVSWSSASGGNSRTRWPASTPGAFSNSVA